MTLATASAVDAIERELARPGREHLLAAFTDNARSLTRFQAAAQAVAAEMSKEHNQPLRDLFGAATADDGKALEAMLAKVFEGKETDASALEARFPGVMALLAEERVAGAFAEYGAALAEYRDVMARLQEQLRRPMNRHFVALLEKLGPQAREEISLRFSGK
jgi:hypothetical protein